jgi:tetratricopeptide (TPR) repeat protein
VPSRKSSPAASDRNLQIVSPGEAQSPATTAPPPGQRDRDAAAAAAAHRSSFELQPIAPTGVGAGPKASSPSPAAAQAVFQAKLPPGKQDQPRRGWLFAAAAAIVVAVIAAGAYVWYVMQTLAPSPVRRDAWRAPSRQLHPHRRSPHRRCPRPRSRRPGLHPPRFPDSPRRPRRDRDYHHDHDNAGAAQRIQAPPAPPTREQTAAELLRQAPGRQEAPPLRLDRGPSGPRIPAEVAAGYQALRNSDLPAARRAYEAALAADATNVDALLGMATIEARSGNAAAAGASYRKALELDPRNPTALAGLASLADPSRRGTVEARLREDLMRYPQSPALHFALGNVYRRRRAGARRRASISRRTA